MPSKYRIITTFKEVKQLADYCIQTGYCSFDYETNGEKVNKKSSYPTVMGVSFQTGFSYIIPLGHFDSPFKKNWKKIHRYFAKRVFENPKVIKVAWNLKFEHTWLIKYNLQLIGILMDGMLAKHLLDENTLNDLKTCVKNTIPEFADYEDEVEVLVKKYGGWDKVPLEPLSMYCGKDADLTLRLMLHYEKSLIKARLYNLFRNSSMMSSRVWAEAEFHGMPINKPYLESLVEKYGKLIADKEIEIRNLKPIRIFNKALMRKQLNKLIQKVEDEIEELEKSDKPNATKLIQARQVKIANYLAGNFSAKEKPKQINFASPAQMVEFFYTSRKGLRLPKQYKKDKKTKQMKLTTEEKALEVLKPLDKSGFVDMLLKHRGLSKLYSTYIVGMLDKMDDNNWIHPWIKIHGTVTGRFSGDLQQVPRVTTNADIKPMFIAPPGFVVLELDYAQAELRIAAEEANEIEMIDWFNKKISIHVAVACKAEGADYNIVYPITKDKKHPEYLHWTKRKKRAKTINFGIIYGQTPLKLAETLNYELEPGEKPTTVEEAAKFMKDWFKLFPRIAKWIKKQHAWVRKEGYVTNMFGRKRRLFDKIDSGVKWIIEEAERLAVNTPIQGTSADFTNLSAIVIREHRQRGNLPWDMFHAYTVHDSIIFFIRPKYIHDVVPKLIAICENPETQPFFGFRLKKVKMKAEPEIGINWGALEEYSPKVDYTKLLN